METNEQLTELLALDLGIEIKNRNPYAKEVFKVMDLDLLPHSSSDTILCEIFEWNGRNWRTTNNNLIGLIFQNEEIAIIRDEILAIPKSKALVPDFEFTKEHIIELGSVLPSLFGIKFTGNISGAKNVSIKVNNITKARLTNITPPGFRILKALSEFIQKNPPLYRNHIKSNYLTKALFYADSVQINIEKENNIELEVDFQTPSDISVDVISETKKKISLKYADNSCPFAATFVKGKDFNLD